MPIREIEAVLALDFRVEIPVAGEFEAGPGSILITRCMCLIATGKVGPFGIDILIDGTVLIGVDTELNLQILDARQYQLVLHGRPCYQVDAAQ